MRIGFDIDDTTLVTFKSMIKYADKYTQEDLGHEGIKGNFGLITNRYYLNILYGWDDTTKFAFFDKYYKNVLEECVPFTNSPEIITKLKEEGNDIYFITARLSHIKNCDVVTITKDTFNKYHIPYDYLIVNVKDKLQYCLDNKIDLFIEDSYDTCVELEKHGIKTILVTTKMNQDIVDETMTRANNWNEIYQIISEMK